jgi:hypothetical protein
LKKEKFEKEPKNPNAPNKDEIERQKDNPERIDPAKSQETDAFSVDEQKTIVQRVMDDFNVGDSAWADWKSQKEKDLQHISADKPSVIEGLTKKAWMSDRNLGLLPGTLDIYQATLMATCYNPDTIHFIDTEQNDVNNRDNLEKFTKWAVGPQEINLDPEVDDFISNRVSLGFSAFEIDWEIKYEWVDKRIPIYSKPGKNGKKRVIKYKLKTEKRRFERGVIKNIDDIDDLVLPSYGKNIQELPFVIRIVHLMLSDIDKLEKRKIIIFKKQQGDRPASSKFKGAAEAAAGNNSLRKRKAEALGNFETIDPDSQDFPIEVYKWYGYLTRNGRRERYRVLIEPTTETFLSGKPLRKIRRDGKIPIVAGPFRRVPGQIKGGSLTGLIAPLINALNNNYNQTSDFQTIQNMPFGFANFEEGFTDSVYDIEPGKVYDVEGNPAEKVYFPNLQRSLAWSAQDKQFLLEMIERLTGAASYFLTSKSQQSTATRDNIVEQKGETKFGIWVRRIQNDIIEALNMCISNYQDWAPPNLAKRVLGKDGKQIIRNLSIDTLRGNYDARMSPDLASGSKAYEKQVMMVAGEVLNAQCVWMNPQVNPRGNWLFWKDWMMKQGIANAENYLPPQPKQGTDDDEEAKQEFTRMMQGEVIDPPEGVTPAVVRHFATHLKQKETEYNDLDEEYRGNFDNHFFTTYMNYQKFMQQVQQQQQEMAIAAKAVQNLERLGIKPQGQVPPVAPEQSPLPGQVPNRPEPMMGGMA